MKQFLAYFIEVFRPNGQHNTKNVNLRLMHGINRISILMFLFCLIVLIYRWLS